MGLSNIEDDYSLVQGIVLDYLAITREEIDRNHEQGYYPMEITVTSSAPELIVAYEIGNLLLDVASDHVYAFARAISNHPLESSHPLVFSPMTIVRNVLEACSLSSWFFDPNIEPEDRCNRCYAILFKDKVEEIKLYRSLGENRTLKKLEKERDILVDNARNKGYKIFYDDKKRPTGIGEIYPGPTALVRDQLKLEPAYRLCSAIVHCRYDAIKSIGYSLFQKLPGDEYLVEKTLRPELPNILSSQSVMALHHSLIRKFDLYGWNTITILEAASHTFEKIEEVWER